MNKFEKNVPFDPGFSPLSFSFIENIQVATQEYSKMSANHQKKFWLAKFEPTIVDFICKTSAFYLGCILWGGFIHCRFKDSPKEITGNNTDKLSEREKSELDCAVEVKAIIEYIKNFDRDCKYFLKRPAKIPPIINEILDNYIEFASLNNNFINVKNTSGIKLPEAVSHFNELNEKQLDELCEKINASIDSAKIETLLDIGFYRNY